ncbi:MAG TPA: hypothetical protein VMU84_02360 [Thermoanaerobaculia bacterium]|nr:hypothetical protein [Thermoanaerobaculia bacterium]
MTEVYRKRGRVARWENGWVVRVVEHGEAIEDGAMFTCRPLPHEREDIDATNVERVAAALTMKSIERLIITEGIADHEFADRRWTETTQRIHCALVKDRIRALIDLATFDVDAITYIAEVLARTGDEREAPKHLRLAANVSAALLPSMNVAKSQVAEGIDGKGQPIVETIGANWYRPSYRVRPMRMPMNVRAHATQTQIDRDLPVAVAVLEPPYVLIDDHGAAYPAKLNVTRIEAVDDRITFYPYAAGSFGAEMMF